jgi:carboxypeptidase C (cathepsin A)
MTVFFNQQKIKTQLHVNTSIQWESCSDAVYDRYKKDNSSLQILNKLKDHKLKILLYSGNTDAVVSYVETVAYIKNLGWKEITHQKPFINDKNSLLGW